ncbi:MAG: DUF2202 domain-containing protein [Chloroflexi bacterium]|nr:DUF2202 domain-containing protein [Chloroflexota bacterium]
MPAMQASDDLNEDEIADMLYMREEEKLARDVYITLNEQWDQPVFQNISKAEQQHMDAVLTLLERYEISDPALGQDVGQFTNPELQQLYDELVATGSQSLADALKVGAAIEEIDILDLEKSIADTENADIQQVYEYLKSGSENHLRAFTSTLERQTGETYSPQYLEQSAYDAILAGSNGGHGNGQGGQGHGNGQGSQGQNGHGQSGHGQGGHGQGGHGQGSHGQGGHGQGSHGEGTQECLNSNS